MSAVPNLFFFEEELSMVYLIPEVYDVRRKLDESAVQRSACNSGELLEDHYNKVDYNYTYRTDVSFKDTLIPSKAPCEFENRQNLWNQVDRSEKRSNAITAREFRLPFYKGLPLSKRIDLLLNCTSAFFVAHDMCADIALHEKADGFSHGHVLITTRVADSDGFSTRKNSFWNHKALNLLWKLLWSDALNIALERYGIIVEENSEELFVQHGISCAPIPPNGLGYYLKFAIEQDGINVNHLNDSIALMFKRELTDNYR
jgi:hypothetical protein